MRKKFSINELSQKSTLDIVDDMSNSHYSLLRSFGCGYMNIIFFWVRLACLFFLNMSARRARNLMKKYRFKKEAALKASLGKIFERGAPWIIDPSFLKIDYNYGLIIGFNHPSLGEIIRLMGICMLFYEKRKYLFPVNLIWFEALAPIIDRLADYGFTLMPIITPTAKNTLMKHAKTLEAKAQVERLTRGFSNIYVNASAEFIDAKQIVLVAPSARRSFYVFRNRAVLEGKESIKPQTMTLLVSSLIHRGLDFLVLPVAVIPPKGATRGLNLLRKYLFSPCPASSAEMCRQMCEEREVFCSSRRFERFFLEVIANRLTERNAGHMVCDKSD